MGAASVDFTSAGAIGINTTTITTTGAQTYNGPVTLGTNVAITSGSDGVIFGNTLSNGTAYSLTIDAGTGPVEFNGAVGGGGTPLSSVTVNPADGGVAINAAMNVGAGTINLTTNAGISGAGLLTGSSLIATATSGISLTAANDVASVVLNNNQPGATGHIVYNSGHGPGISITANNQAASGNIVITEATGDITVGAGGITTAGTTGTSVQVSAAGEITINGPIAGSGLAQNTGGAASFISGDNEDITVNGNITGFLRLALIAGSPNTSTGDIVVNGNITVTQSGVTEGANAPVYLWADYITGSGTTTTTTGVNGNVDIYYSSSPDGAYLSDIATSGGRTYHLHLRDDRHIVYGPADPGPFADAAGNSIGSPGNEYHFLDSSLSSTGVYYAQNGKNIYIRDVGNNLARTPTFTVNGNGFIEIRGNYTSSGLLTLNPGAGGIRLNNANIDLGANAFDIANANKNVTLYNSPNLITATGIILGGTVEGSGQGLTLNAGTTGDIIVSGAIGTNTDPLGAIQITNAGDATFSSAGSPAAVYATSFTQLAGTGTTTFYGAQDYTGAFTFDGNNITLASNASLTTGAAVTIDNDGAFTVSGGANISAGGAFSQIGGGTVNVGADISTTNTSPANASITFADTVGLTGDVEMDSSAGGGAMSLAAVTGLGQDLTLNAGTGDIIVSGAIGTGTDPLDVIQITNAGDVTFSSAGSPAAVYAASFTQLAGTGTTTFYGVQDYTGAFTFIGTSLTVNSTLETDTDGTSAAGPIAITVSGLGTPLFTVGASGSILPGGPGGTITVNGNTVNNGTITASPDIAVGNDGIVFDGNYTVGLAGPRSLVGNTTNNSNIVFKGDVVFGSFTHNGDTVQFSTSTALVSAHAVSQVGTDPELADVIIDATNTVTVANGTTIVQDLPGAGGTLTLTGDAVLILSDSGTAGTWFVGPPSVLPSPWYMLSNPSSSSTGDPNYVNAGPEFTGGFAGFNGTLVMGDRAKLETKNFYTQITDTVNTPNHTFTLTTPSGASEMCFISASGHVTINETFVNVANSTLTMTGNNMRLAVRSHLGPLPPPPLPPVAVRVTDVDLGSFTADAAGSDGTIINSDLVFKGNVRIEPTMKLSAGLTDSSYNNIQVEGDWTQTGGTFIPQHSVVEFGVQGYATPGRTFNITGDTTWYNLVCVEPMATLAFSNSPDIHSVANIFLVEPWNSNGDRYLTDDPSRPNKFMILLTRQDNSSGLIPPFIPDTQPPLAVTNDFWYFELKSGAQLHFDYVYVQYGWAKNRIPLPTNNERVIIAFPYVYMGGDPLSPTYTLGDPRNDPSPNFATSTSRSYYTHNWLVADYFFYSFTEDSNANGRIDRIRAQAAFDLTGKDENAFSNFRVAVEGYEIDTSRGINGYARVDEDQTIFSDSSISTAMKNAMKDMIFIYLKEKDYSDTGAQLVWRIEQNTSLRDLTTNSIDMRLRDGWMLTDDTAPPRINYALVMPGGGEIYTQFSEPVEMNSMEVSIPSRTPGAHYAAGGDTELLIPFSPPYAVTDLVVPEVSFPKFTLKGQSSQPGVRDKAAFVLDFRTQAVTSVNPYPYLYPSPKYPIDWKYLGYEEISGPFTSAPYFRTIPLLSPPGSVIKNWDPAFPENLLDNRRGTGNPSPNPDYGEDIHRVTDVLISSSPARKDDPGFFVWPVWARYTTLPNDGTFPVDDADWGTGGSQNTDTGIIWDFTGKKFLEERNTTIQAMANTALSPNPVTMRFGFNVPNEYRNPPEYNTSARGSSGLWLPDTTGAVNPPSFFNLVPNYYSGDGTKIQDGASTPANSLYIYRFDTNADPGYKSPSRFDFLFHLNNTPDDLFAARLDTTVPGPWYYQVRPFSYDIRDVTLQRGGATILNNVINPNNGERTYIRYHLVKSGRVTVQVFTLDGTLIKTLRRENRNAGEWVDSWDGTNNGGRSVARGMYFIRVVGPDIDEIRKVMVVK
jgi:hypothetical protein